MASSMSAPGTDAVRAGRVISGSPSMTDGEEPGRDHGAARGPGPRRRRRRARGQRSVLRLEQVRDVLHRVHRDGLGARIVATVATTVYLSGASSRTTVT